jgi:hypothetical protein
MAKFIQRFYVEIEAADNQQAQEIANAAYDALVERKQMAGYRNGGSIREIGMDDLEEDEQEEA